MNNLKEMLKLVDDTNVLAKQAVELANKVIENQRIINKYFELEKDFLNLNIQVSDTNNSVDNDTNDNKEEITEKFVSEYITKLGIPAHIKGYRYVITAIMLAVNDFDIINSITKRLYPTVAKMHNTTSARVERAIRHAIEVAWERGDIEVLNNLFGYTINSNKGKPTNSEFIAMIATKLIYKN